MRLALLALLLPLAACSQPGPARAPADAAPAVVTAADATCRPTQPGRRMTLCSVTLTSSADDALIAVESSRAGRVALQDVPIENGMVVVTPRAGPLALAARRPVRLSDGSTAVALQGLDRPVAAGERIPLRFVFNRAAAVEVTAVVPAG